MRRIKDYLPFGEELFAAVGGCSAALGYVSGDGVRKRDFVSSDRIRVPSMGHNFLLPLLVAVFGVHER